MNLTISGHHLEVTPALSAYITTKIGRTLVNFDKVTTVKVLLKIKKARAKEDSHHIQCNIHVKGKDIFAESVHADMYAALDLLIDKLTEQIVANKEKIKSASKTSAKRTLQNKESVAA